MTSKEDIRDNVIHYDDEGGGEEDTQAFDIGALRNPKVIEDNNIRRDIKPDSLCLPRQRPPVEDNNVYIREGISWRFSEEGNNLIPQWGWGKPDLADTLWIRKKSCSHELDFH